MREEYSVIELNPRKNVIAERLVGSIKSEYVSSEDLQVERLLGKLSREPGE